jgi:hypothetical protein
MKNTKKHPINDLIDRAYELNFNSDASVKMMENLKREQVIMVQHDKEREIIILNPLNPYQPPENEDRFYREVDLNDINSEGELMSWVRYFCRKGFSTPLMLGLFIDKVYEAKGWAKDSIN